MAWIILDDLQDLRDIVIVRKPEDVGKPELIGGVMSIRQGAFEYELQAGVDSTFPLALPLDGGQATWTTVNRASWKYTGTDACFRDLEANGFLELKGQNQFEAPNGQMLDVKVKSGGSWGIQGFGLPRYTNTKSLGFVKGGGFNNFFGTYSDFEDGLVLEDMTFDEHNLMFIDANDNQVLNYDGQTVAFTRGEVVTDDGPGSASGIVEFDRNAGTSGKLTLSGVLGVFTDNAALTGSVTGVAVVDGILEDMVIFTVQGINTSGPVNFVGLDWFSGVNETLWDLKKEIETNVDTISLLNSRSQITAKPTAFAPDSLDQTNIKVTASDNTFFPDSTVKAKLEIEGNALVTNTTVQDIAVPINAIWSDGTLEERMCFQDFCTFDNTTNTLTAINESADPDVAFNHGLSNGDEIFLIEDGGLPTELTDKQEFFVINVTATTFQISLTEGGSAVTFSDDGTPPNYYCHQTGASASGWVIYIGVQDVPLVVNGWIGLDKSGTSQEAGARLIKTDVNFNEILAARGSKATVQQGKGQSSTVSDLITLSTFEGVRTFAENRTPSPDTVIVTDADLTFTKA